MSSPRRLAWVGLLAGSVVLLRYVGRGDLAAPPSDSLDRLAQWLDARDAATAAIALVRLAAEAGAWYLLALTALHGIADLTRSAPLRRIADLVSIAGTDRVVRAGLGLSLLAVTAAGRPETALSAEGGSTARMAPVVRDEVGTARMVPVAPDAPATESERDVEPAPSTPAAPDTTRTDTAWTDTTWTVAAGESFWTIADDVLTQAWGRPPLDREIDPYWRSLIAQNHHRLVDANDPDLLHPGQVLELPAPPAPTD